MNSCLYECSVLHARFTPRPHRFVYRLFLFAIDLDELTALHRKLPFFSVNRANLYSFREQDFFPTHEPLHNAPAILPNDARLSRFVFNQTKDLVRGVSKHVSIGRASRGTRQLDNWFVLCRVS